MKERGCRYKKAQSFLAHALIVAVIVGALLAINVYVKRSMQGQLRSAGDQIADQYAHGLTDGHDHFSSSSHTFEISTPGWNSPITITRTGGSYFSSSNKKIMSLDETWYPGAED